MAQQKFRPARLGVFSGAKAYIEYVEVHKKRRNAGGRTFCDTIIFYNNGLMRATSWSAVNPNFSISALPGALAPNPVMQTTTPEQPT